MKAPLLFLLLLPALTACRPGSAPQPRVALSHVSLLPHTPVKDQGALPVCWAYAMLSLIESDRMADGDSVNLSAADAVRTAATEALYAGTLPRDLRGTGVTLLRIVSRTGTAAYDAAPDLSHEAGERLLSEGRRLNARRRKSIPAPDATKAATGKTNRLTERTERLTEIAGRLTATTVWANGFMPDADAAAPALSAMPDATGVRRLVQGTFGPEPPRKPWDGGRYEGFTCLPDSGYGRPVLLDVPDNRERARFMNLPLEALMDTVRATLGRGRTLAWQGDVSEATCSFEAGTATWPVSRRAVNERERARDLRSGQTTDDHMMHLVGTAHSRDGRFFFVLKNSYGRTGRFGGYLLMDGNYFRMKTLAVYRRDTL